MTANPASAQAAPIVTTVLSAGSSAGRFLMIIPILALAGNLASKKLVPASAGTFQTEGVTFVVLLIGTVVLVGALTHLPALAIGPVVEHYLTGAGTLF